MLNGFLENQARERCRAGWGHAQTMCTSKGARRGALVRTCSTINPFHRLQIFEYEVSGIDAAFGARHLNLPASSEGVLRSTTAHKHLAERRNPKVRRATLFGKGKYPRRGRKRALDLHPG